jgi:hypothetical protein
LTTASAVVTEGGPEGQHATTGQHPHTHILRNHIPVTILPQHIFASSSDEQTRLHAAAASFLNSENHLHLRPSLCGAPGTQKERQFIAVAHCRWPQCAVACSQSSCCHASRSLTPRCCQIISEMMSSAPFRACFHPLRLLQRFCNLTFV